jgi:hypothetical protein
LLKVDDHYAALGVARDASDADIKAAYRRLSRTAHPDMGGSAARFGEITAAYETLMDRGRRARHDAVLRDAERSGRTPPSRPARPGETNAERRRAAAARAAERARREAEETARQEAEARAEAERRWQAELRRREREAALDAWVRARDRAQRFPWRAAPLTLGVLTAGYAAMPSDVVAQVRDTQVMELLTVLLAEAVPRDWAPVAVALLLLTALLTAVAWVRKLGNPVPLVEWLLGWAAVFGLMATAGRWPDPVTALAVCGGVGVLWVAWAVRQQRLPGPLTAEEWRSWRVWRSGVRRRGGVGPSMDDAPG